MQNLISTISTDMCNFLKNPLVSSTVGGAIGASISFTSPVIGALSGASGFVAAEISLYLLNAIWKPTSSTVVSIPGLENPIAGLLIGVIVTTGVTAAFSASPIGIIATTIGTVAGFYFTATAK